MATMTKHSLRKQAQLVASRVDVDRVGRQEAQARREKK